MKVTKNDKGFSLLEMIFVMAIFTVIIMVTTKTFDKILSETSQLKKTSETNIEGIVGLEVLRKDLASAGYGIPWSLGTISYGEALSDLTPGFAVDGIVPNSLNDAPSGVPRAIASGSSTATTKMIDGSATAELTNPGTDYLSIKAVNVSLVDCARKWSYVNYSGAPGTNLSYIKQSSSADERFAANDSIITLVDSLATGKVRSLAQVGATDFSYKYSGSSPPQTVYKPGSNIVRSSDGVSITQDMYTVYGVNNLSGSDTIRMPFNRVDYFVKRPITDMPSYCNKGTGVLYKAVVNNTTEASNGGKYLTQMPLLDCVGDLQVVYELDTSGTDKKGVVAYADSLSGMSAQAIREQLRTIRVYLLVQEGKKDRNFSYPYTDASKVIVVGDPNLGNLGRILSKTSMDTYFGADWINYRWKVFTIAVSPKNLYN